MVLFLHAGSLPRGGDGLYTEPSETVDAEEEDNSENDQRPCCPNCGGRNFRIHATEWRRHLLSHSVSGLDNEPDDGTLWYDRDLFESSETDESSDVCVQTIYCAGCEHDVTGRISADEGY